MKKTLAAASSGSYKFGLVLCLIHLVISWWVIITVGLSEPDAQWQLVWIIFLPFDFPFSLLVLFAGDIFPDWSLRGFSYPLGDFISFIVPAFIHGTIGPLWYFFLPVYIDGLMTIRRRRRR
jgi:hypothetical protein